MLVIARKENESFLLDDDIEIFILDIQSDKVRIGINAPKSVQILRKELYDTKKTNEEATVSINRLKFDELKRAIKNKNNEKST